MFAADMISGEIKAELPVGDLAYEPVLDRAGSFSASIPLRHPKANRDNLSTGNTLIYIQRDARVVFAGILWQAKASNADDAKVQLSGEGLWSYWAGTSGGQTRGRVLKVDKTYTDADQLDVARDLLAYSMGNSGGFRVSVDERTSGILVSRQWFGYERRNIGAQIQTECAVADGYDFYIDSAWDGDQIVNTLWFSYPPLGRRTDIVLSLGSNIESLTLGEDATTQTNDVDVKGSGDGASTLFGRAQDYTLVGTRYPVYESEFQDTNNTSADVLNAEASALLTANKTPYVTLDDVVVKVTPNTQPGAWAVGDQVTMRGQDGWVDFDGWYRIVSYKVTLDSEGGETVTLSTAPVEATTVVRRPDGEWFRINDLESRVYALEYKS